jgi:hypothetical protein
MSEIFSSSFPQQKRHDSIVPQTDEDPSVLKGHDFRGCGKTPSDGGFWVAQRFSAAVSALLCFAAFIR